MGGSAREMEVLVLELEDVRYGVAVDAVEEVLRAARLVPLPGAPPVVEGVVDVRGRIVPVMDVRSRFGHAPKALDPDDRFVVVRAGERTVALRVDGAVGLVRLDPADVEDPRRLVAQSPRIAGIAKTRDGLVLIQDLPAFLSQAEGAALDGALEASAGEERSS